MSIYNAHISTLLLLLYFSLHCLLFMQTTDISIDLVELYHKSVTDVFWLLKILHTAFVFLVYISIMYCRVICSGDHYGGQYAGMPRLYRLLVKLFCRLFICLTDFQCVVFIKKLIHFLDNKIFNISLQL